MRELTITGELQISNGSNNGHLSIDLMLQGLSELAVKMMEMAKPTLKNVLAKLRLTKDVGGGDFNLLVSKLELKNGTVSNTLTYQDACTNFDRTSFTIKLFVEEISIESIDE